MDEDVGESETPPEKKEYTAKAGDGPLAIAKGIDPENPYAVMAKLAAEGKISYDPATNRWRTVEGQTYTADLSGMSDEDIAVLDQAGRRAVSAEGSIDTRRAAVAQAQGMSQDDIAVLDQAGRRAVSAEGSIDTRRAAVAQAQAAIKAQQDAQAAQAAAAQQAATQQAAGDAAGAARNPSLTEQASNAIEQQRKSDQASTTSR